MVTHRRGLRPSQWAVRDLLGTTADRGRLWDARIGAATAGLLACGAAVTVVLTSGDAAAPDEPAETPQPPQALPRLTPAVPEPAPPAQKVPPVAVVPPVLPAPAAPRDVGPAPVAPPRVAPPRAARSGDRPAAQPTRAPVATPARVPEPALAGQIAVVIEQEDRAVAGWLLVPVQRPADTAALIELACRPCEPTAGGRHRAPDHDVEQRAERREGGRHRAPERDDERSHRYVFAHDADEEDGDRDDRDRDDRDDRDRDDRDRDDWDDWDDRDPDGALDRDSDRAAPQDEHEPAADCAEETDEEFEGDPDDVPRWAGDASWFDDRGTSAGKSDPHAQEENREDDA